MSACEKESTTFAKLLQDIATATRSKGFVMVIHLSGSGDPGGYHALYTSLLPTPAHLYQQDYSSKLRFLHINSYSIDLKDVRQFAKVVVDPATGAKNVIGPAPAYAITQCQVLGHELRELWDGYENRFIYKNNHAVALQLENQIRAEYGQRPRSNHTIQPALFLRLHEAKGGINRIVCGVRWGVGSLSDSCHGNIVKGDALQVVASGIAPTPLEVEFAAAIDTLRVTDPRPFSNQSMCHLPDATS